MDGFRIVAACCITLCLAHCFGQAVANYQCPFAQLQQEHQATLFGDASFIPAAAPYIPPAAGYDELELLKMYFAGHVTEKMQCAIPPANCANDSANYYYRTIDGSCNNLQYPEYGMARSRYVRMMAPKYGDDSSPTLSTMDTPLPNARLLSMSLYGEDTKPDSQRTLASLMWGQFVSHDLSALTKSDAPKDCCANPQSKYCYSIPLPPFDPIAQASGKSCLSFARSASDADATCSQSQHAYAEKISGPTAYLDLSSLYGNNMAQNRKVRQYSGGLLRTSVLGNRQWPPVSANEDGECGENNYQCYSIPDNRNQFTPTIALYHTILLREHNSIAAALAHMNPQYSDEQIYQVARKINIGQYQKIVFYDWLPIIIGSSYAYANGLIHYAQNGEYVNDYDPNVNAAPYAEFSAAAFRYSHNQIPGWFSMFSPHRDQNLTMRLSDYFERPENLNLISHGGNYDALIRGLLTQPQKVADKSIDKEIKHFFNRKQYEDYGTDLKATDIQRARDYGMPSYNDFRQYCGLPRAYEWSDFSGELDADTISNMQRLYASPEDVELSVGGSLESHTRDSNLGPTFQCIIGRQFLKTRTGDRFFFEHEDIYGGFTREQLAEIRKVTLSGLLCKNADYLQYIQPNAFILPSMGNDLTNCANIPQMDLTKWATA